MIECILVYSGQIYRACFLMSSLLPAFIQLWNLKAFIFHPLAAAIAFACMIYCNILSSFKVW